MFSMVQLNAARDMSHQFIWQNNQLKPFLTWTKHSLAFQTKAQQYRYVGECKVGLIVTQAARIRIYFFISLPGNQC